MALSVLVMVVICFFFITSSDSSSYVVATILSDDKEVRSFNKIAWSLIQCVAAMILFYCGGLLSYSLRLLFWVCSFWQLSF